MDNSVNDNQSDINTEIKNVLINRVALCRNLILASQLQKALPDAKFEKRGSLHAALQEISEESRWKASKVKTDKRRVSFQLPRKSMYSTEVTMEEYVAPRNQNIFSDKFVKNLPVPMKEKRYYRKSIIESTFKKKSTYTEYYDSIKRHWPDFKSKFYIWNDTLKTIEGRHGAAIVAYFVFIRWLLCMNIFIFLLYFFFLVIPQSICTELTVDAIQHTSSFTYDASKLYTETIQQSSLQNDTTEYKEYELFNLEFVNGSARSGLNMTNATIDEIVSYCMMLYSEQQANASHNGVIAFFQNLLQGTGPLESTYLFLGSYAAACNTSYGHFYNIATASLFLLLATLIICLVMMIMYSSTGIQEAFLARNERSNYYSNEIFCAWDYSINNPESAAQQHHRFVSEIKISLCEERKRQEISARSTLDWAKLYAIRITVNVFIITWLWSCFYLLYNVAVYQLKEQQQNYSTKPGFHTFFLQYIISFTLVILNGTSPIVFSVLVTFEKYSAQTEVNISLFRNIFLYLSSFIVIISTLYREIACEEKDICGAGISLTCKIPRCWETYIGQLFYKLCVTDLFVHIGLFLGYDCVLYYLTQNYDNKFTKLWGNPVFYLPTEVLAPIFSQTIVWFGVFYSPLIPAIMILKLIIVFYIKKTKVMIFCKPIEHVYRASRFNSVFISLLLISFFIVLIVLGFEIDRIGPSRGCGPFRFYNSMSGAAPHIFRHWVSLLTSYWSITITSTLLCLMIHYYWRVNVSQRELTKRLKSQLVLHSYDKQYLLKSIAQLTRTKESESQ